MTLRQPGAIPQPAGAPPWAQALAKAVRQGMQVTGEGLGELDRRFLRARLVARDGSSYAWKEQTLGRDGTWADVDGGACSEMPLPEGPTNRQISFGKVTGITDLVTDKGVWYARISGSGPYTLAVYSDPARTNLIASASYSATGDVALGAYGSMTVEALPGNLALPHDFAVRFDRARDANGTASDDLVGRRVLLVRNHDKNQQRPAFSFGDAGSGGGITMSWGKAIADYSSGNTVTLTPCQGQTDPTPTGDPDVLCTIVSPHDAAPAPVIAAGDILAFVRLTDTTGLLMPVVQQGTITVSGKDAAGTAVSFSGASKLAFDDNFALSQAADGTVVVALRTTTTTNLKALSISDAARTISWTTETITVLGSANVSTSTYNGGQC